MVCPKNKQHKQAAAFGRAGPESPFLLKNACMISLSLLHGAAAALCRIARVKPIPDADYGSITQFCEKVYNKF